MRLHWLVLLGLTLGSGTALADDTGKDLAKQAMGVLDKYCARCHGVAKESGDLDVRLHKSLLSKSEESEPYIVPKSAAKSYIYQRIEKEEMPPSPTKVTPAERKILKAWIDAGAPESVEVVKERPFITMRDMLTAIRDHMRSQDEEDQPYQRYFILTNAHNDSRVKDADLRQYRAALSKAINSLTWKRGIVLPEAIDKAGTIYAIDLRDLDWDRKPGEKIDMWQQMMKFYPYGMKHTEDEDRTTRQAAMEIHKMSYRKLVYMRADWFVATATRPPLYHTILRLPEHAYDLEKKLGVDIVANFKRGRLWRAGFIKSGVSAQNRLIERHDALHGSYWKSYDFKKGSKKANLLELPLGPNFSATYGKKYKFADSAFVHDGGEVIFHLPNGLMGYFLLDGKDNRIDAGPEDVVNDEQKTSGTPAIVTGLSCMTCHAKGTVWSSKKEWDVIREGTSVSGIEKIKVRQLYPVHETVMKRKMKEDSDQYMAALEKATGPFLFTKENKEVAQTRVGEPIGKWARKYRLEDPGLDDLAYELGMKPAELLAAINANSKLRELGMAGLRRPDGAVKRADWESLEGQSLYQRVAKELGIGDPWSPE